MKLFHISRDVNTIKTFGPRIPTFSDSSETNIDRICVSSSIEGCIAATIRWWFKDVDLKNGELKFYKFSEARVYEFDSKNVMPCNIVLPHKIKSEYGVFDAECTSEFWILNQQIQPVKNYLVKFKSCNHKLSYYKIQDTEREKFNPPYSHFELHTISNLKYIKLEPEKYIQGIKSHYEQFNLESVSRSELEKLIDDITLQLVVRHEMTNEITNFLSTLLNKCEMVLNAM